MMRPWSLLVRHRAEPVRSELGSQVRRPRACIGWRPALTVPISAHVVSSGRESRTQTGARRPPALNLVGNRISCDLAEFTSIVVPLLVFLDGMFSDNGCPKVTETSIVGNCTTTDGTRYEGSAELEPNTAGLFPSVTYRGLRFTDSEGGSLYLDGTVVFTQESDEELRYDLAMILEIQDDFDAEADRLEVKASATCRMQDEVSASCTPGGWSRGADQGPRRVHDRGHPWHGQRAERKR